MHSPAPAFCGWIWISIDLSPGAGIGWMEYGGDATLDRTEADTFVYLKLSILVLWIKISEILKPVSSVLGHWWISVDDLVTTVWDSEINNSVHGFSRNKRGYVVINASKESMPGKLIWITVHLAT